MNAVDLLPTTQQAALRALDTGRLRFRGNAGGYVHPDGSQHPVRTLRALSRAGLVQLIDSGAQLTERGRELLHDQPAMAGEGNC